MDPRPSEPPYLDPFDTGATFGAPTPIGGSGSGPGFGDGSRLGDRAGFGDGSGLDDLVSVDGSMGFGALAALGGDPTGDRAAMSSSPAPRRLSSTIAVATLVTAIVTGPLWVMTSSGPGTVLAEGIEVNTDGRTEPLALASLDPDAVLEAEIEVDIPGAVAIAWAMERVDGEVTTRGTSTGPDSLRVPVPEAFVEAGPGLVDLLVTATLDSGDTVKRAARFSIGDVT